MTGRGERGGDQNVLLSVFTFSFNDKWKHSSPFLTKLGEEAECQRGGRRVKVSNRLLGSRLKIRPSRGWVDKRSFSRDKLAISTVNQPVNLTP